MLFWVRELPMLKVTLLSVSALLAIALSTTVTSADDEGAQEGPAESTSSAILRAALLDAQSRRFLDDDYLDALIWVVDVLRAARANEASAQVQEQSPDSLPPEAAAWEGSFPILLSKLEEASRTGTIDDKLENALATLIIHTITENTWETSERVRERLLEKIAGGPIAISETSGTRTNPVPVYETAMYGDTAITVLSSNIAASTAIEGWGRRCASRRGARVRRRPRAGRRQGEPSWSGLRRVRAHSVLREDNQG